MEQHVPTVRRNCWYEYWPDVISSAADQSQKPYPQLCAKELGQLRKIVKVLGPFVEGTDAQGDRTTQ